MSAKWEVAAVAQTVDGEVVLKMTEQQAKALRDCLAWLVEDDGS